MRKILSILTLILLLGSVNSLNSGVYAQSGSPEIAGALSRLKNNPRYQGRILGTHVTRDRGRLLYEVRILRPDDRVILVYIDPETGGVVGDSDRRQLRTVNPNRTNRDNRDNRDFGGRPNRQDRDIRRGLR